MKPVTSNMAIAWLLGSIVVYWVLATIVDALVLRDIFNNIQLGIAVMVAITWFPGAWHAFSKGADEGEWVLVIGVFAGFSVLVIQRIYAIAYLILDRPVWLQNSPISGFITYLLALVGMMFLIAPGIATGAPRGRYWWYIVGGVAVGCLVTGVMIGLSLQGV